MKKILIRLLVLILIVLSGILFYNRVLLKQGLVIIEHQLRARPMNEMLENPDTSEKTKAFIQRVASIKSFAVEHCGLKDNKNYTTYVSLDRNFLHYLVSASEPLEFKPYLWSYPLFGSFPYLGFFDKTDFDAEVPRLNNLKLDVYTRRPRAFSSMGILKDPVYSYMENYSIFGLANLIIHEQTHATVYITSQTRFNEELASFVGTTGALLYIEAQHGRNSREYKQAVAYMADKENFYQFFEKCMMSCRAFTLPIFLLKKN
jgi:predicted aminopeptidase